MSLVFSLVLEMTGKLTCWLFADFYFATSEMKQKNDSQRASYSFVVISNHTLVS